LEVNIFLDESGDLGFGGGSKFFIITTLVIPIANSKNLSRRVKRFNARQYRNGWPKTVEIKATNLWNCSRYLPAATASVFGQTKEEEIQGLLTSICALPVEIDFGVVNLANTDAHLRQLDKSILFNYFARQVLEDRLMACSKVNLYVDQRDKEYHRLAKFDGYIQTQIQIQRHERGLPPIQLDIQHCLSHKVRGLEAVDFVSWILQRSYELNDERWKIDKEKFGRRRHFFFGKREKQ